VVSYQHTVSLDTGLLPPRDGWQNNPQKKEWYNWHLMVTAITKVLYIKWELSPQPWINANQKQNNNKFW